MTNRLEKQILCVNILGQQKKLFSTIINKKTYSNISSQLFRLFSIYLDCGYYYRFTMNVLFFPLF